MSFDLDHAACSLCLDFHADDDTCQHLAAREIASAFLHLTFGAKDLKNTHILWTKQTPATPSRECWFSCREIRCRLHLAGGAT